MKRTLLLFLLLTIVISIGAKIIFAASENSNKPDSPPGQAKKEENSQNNQGNQGNNNNNNRDQGNKPDSPPGQENKPNNPGGGNSQGGGNQDKITFCHVPPGNPAQAHAITADRHAWDNGHSKHEGDFIVDNCHPCPPGGSVPSSCTSNGGGNNNNNSGGGGGSGGGTSSSSVSEKQGEVLGASVLAATGTAQENLAMLLQILGFGATLGAVLYGKSRPSILS